MAVSKIGSIKTTLSLAIDYITNPKKTENYKYTYTYGCRLDGREAEEDFLDVRSLGTGKGTVLAKHIKQSFKAGEVTPEQALEIGIKTAQRFLGDNYQFIVATHTDKEHIHNHIIFNNVDFVNYRTFEWQENRGGISWKNLRKINDELCKEYNLSVIENPRNPGKCYYEWQQDFLGKSWKSKLRRVIDETIMQASSFEDFLEKLKDKKVECVYTPQNEIKIKFRLEGQQRFSRGRTLGWYYDEDKIRRRIEQYKLFKKGEVSVNRRTNIIDTSKGVFQTSKGLLHWAEIKNMQEASRILNILTSNNIGSQADMEKAAVDKYNERMLLVSNLNKTQNEINDIGEVIVLIRTYEKYKPIHAGIGRAKNKNAYKKENAAALRKYDDVVKKLLDLFPDRHLPTLTTLEVDRAALIDEVKKMNERYKETVAELKEIEFARQSLDKYLAQAEKDKNNALE